MDEKFKSFDDFCRVMNELPQLKMLKEKQRSALLDDLYHIAVRKVVSEKFAEAARRSVPWLRNERIKISKLRQLISEAADCLDQACSDCGEQMYDIECFRQFMSQFMSDPSTYSFKVVKGPIDYSEQLGDIEFTKGDLEIGKIAERLRELVVELETREEIIALTIHPRFRTPVEQRLASEANPHKPHRYPLIGPKTPAIDHWFIGAAATCLEKYQAETAMKISNVAQFIGRLFDAAFGAVGRTEGSIDRELRRQKTDGRPDYGKPLRFLDPTWFPRGTDWFFNPHKK